jgi:hypothetical protein
MSYITLPYLGNSKTHSIVTALTLCLDGEDANSSHGKPFCSLLSILEKKKVYIFKI